MRNLLRALIVLSLVLGGVYAAEAGTFTMRWDPSPGAISYDIEQSQDGLTGWTLNKNVPASACTGTPVVCSTQVTAPATGVVHFRGAAINAVGKTIRYSEGVWHCESCAPPVMPRSLGAQ